MSLFSAIGNSELAYCQVCKSTNNIRYFARYCNVCNSRSNVFYYIKESDHISEIKSQIGAKNFEIQNLKFEMSQSEMKAKEELENLRESSTPKKILSM